MMCSIFLPFSNIIPRTMFSEVWKRKIPVSFVIVIERAEQSDQRAQIKGSLPMWASANWSLEEENKTKRRWKRKNCGSNWLFEEEKQDKKKMKKVEKHVVLNCLGHIWGSNWSFHWKKKNKTKSKKKVELNCLDHWGSMWRRESDIAPALFAWNHKYGLDIARNKVHRAFWDMILP